MRQSLLDWLKNAARRVAGQHRCRISCPDMTDSTKHNVTRLLAAMNAGEPQAAEDLLDLIYGELREMAARKMAHEPPGHTLQATALVHEAFLRLAGDGKAQWDNRAHFFSAAAEAMRRILIERARKHGRLKRGGGRKRVELPENLANDDSRSAELLALDEAIGRLETFDKRKSDIVKLRYFVGMTIAETAEALSVSAATVKSDWVYARTWLHREIAGAASSDDDAD
jgi:RNA polymerase sigma factor (TIGR02999 family)